MAIAPEQQWLELKRRLRNGPVGRFLRWWVDELRQSLPESWRQKLQYAQRRVSYQVDDASLDVGVDENRSIRRLGSLPLDQDAALQHQQLADLLEQNDLAESPGYLLLDAGRVLTKELTLPAAAEANLAQVLAFEMDRQTPFKSSDVYFAWKITGHDAPAGQLRVMLYLVPRAEADSAREKLSGVGVGLSGIDIVEDGTTLGLNLLPESERVKIVNRKSRLNWALGGAALVLLVAVMAQSLALRAHEVEELKQAIARVQGEARAVMEIRKQIEDRSAAAGFLANRRAESPLAIELLADVTRILPDDTYLDRLVIGKGRVQMQGKSQNAQRLIELVNESDLLDAAAFRGSTRLDARSGLEIFEVNARIAGAGAQ